MIACKSNKQLDLNYLLEKKLDKDDSLSSVRPILVSKKYDSMVSTSSFRRSEVLCREILFTESAYVLNINGKRVRRRFHLNPLEKFAGKVFLYVAAACTDWFALLFA